jgi:hypothetical protein
MWYYTLDGENRGPVSEAKISELIRHKIITESTLVWSERLSEWQPAGQVSKFTLDFLAVA